MEVLEQEGHKRVFIGFVDMFDILKYVLSMYSEDHQTQVGTIHMWSQDISSLTHKGKNFASHPVTDIIGKNPDLLISHAGISKLDPFCTVNQTGTLANLVYIFKKGIHRVAVTDDKNDISHIATQSNVIQFLARNTQNFGKIRRVPIEDMNLGTSLIFHFLILRNPQQAPNHAQRSKSYQLFPPDDDKSSECLWNCGQEWNFDWKSFHI